MLKFLARCVVLLCVAGQVAANERVLTLGIHPYQSSSKLVRAFTPLADYLTAQLGREVKIVLSPDYQTHIDNAGKGIYDLAYMGPASYVKLRQKYRGDQPLARLVIGQRPTFAGKIVVRQDSKLTQLVQLRNRSFAFGDPASTMSHLVPRYMLLQAGVTLEQFSHHAFLGSHDNVALAVLSGDFDAGAVKEAVFYKYQKRGLRELATTPALSEHLFIARRGLPEKLVKTIRLLMLDLHHQADGGKILTSIKPTVTALGAVSGSDYDNLTVILEALARKGIR